VFRGSSRILAGESSILTLFPHRKPLGKPSNPQFILGLTNAWVSTTRTRVKKSKALPHRAQIVAALSFLCGDGCMNRLPRNRKEPTEISVAQQTERQCYFAL
jgi:hypothetical protein